MSVRTSRLPGPDHGQDEAAVGLRGRPDAAGGQACPDFRPAREARIPAARGTRSTTSKSPGTAGRRPAHPGSTATGSQSCPTPSAHGRMTLSQAVSAPRGRRWDRDWPRTCPGRDARATVRKLSCRVRRPGSSRAPGAVKGLSELHPHERTLRGARRSSCRGCDSRRRFCGGRGSRTQVEDQPPGVPAGRPALSVRPPACGIRGAAAYSRRPQASALKGRVGSRRPRVAVVGQRLLGNFPSQLLDGCCPGGIDCGRRGVNSATPGPALLPAHTSARLGSRRSPELRATAQRLRRGAGSCSSPHVGTLPPAGSPGSSAPHSSGPRDTPREPAPGACPVPTSPGGHL